MLQIILRTYETHRIIFMMGMTAIGLIDLAWVDGWASFYPMMIWGVVFTMHFFTFKSITADDEWAEDHAMLEVYKPWDAAHIQDIKDNPWGKSPHRTDADDGSAGTVPGQSPGQKKKDKEGPKGGS